VGLIAQIIYDIGLHLFVLCSLPKVFYAVLIKGKYRKSFLARLGGVGFPKIEKEGRPLIWIHAVSLGETRAVAPFVKSLKASQLHPKVLLTTATETGYAEGALVGADYHYFLPLDFSYIIYPIVKRVAPDVVIITESDFWPHFQNAAKEQKAKLILLNGKISERSFRRLEKVPVFARALFSSFDLLCLQGKLYKERFLKLGFPEEKMRVTGNIKLDCEIPPSAFTREELGLSEQDLVVTLGSTHSPEEGLFLKYFEELSLQFPHLRLFIAPRHPERFGTIAKLLQRSKIPYASFSSKQGFTEERRVILVDKMGILRSCYSLSDVAFVGGSFIKKIGGHNILEPSFYGVPVLFGPYMHAQPDFLDLIRSHGGGIQITEKTLYPTLCSLLSDEKRRKEIGERGREVIEEGRGAIENSWEAVFSCWK